VGTHSPSSDGAKIELSAVSRIVVDPQFDPQLGHDDVALLILDVPTRAPAVAIAPDGDTTWSMPGTPAVFAGWGRTLYSKPGISQLLHEATTVVQSDSWCNLRSSGFEADSQLCTLDPPRDQTSPCLGDSGGPLLVNDAGKPLEIGVTHAVSEQCSTYGAAVFTNVEVLSSWIDSVIADTRLRG
jgi:secreted trypsin-like serine protease